jgi:hypothetical protein
LRSGTCSSHEEEFWGGSLVAGDPPRFIYEEFDMAKRTKKDEEIRTESAEDLESRDSYTPPSYPNDAVDPDLPHEDERPETRAERRVRERGE